MSLNKSEDKLSPVDDADYDEHHAKYHSNPRRYWDWAARRFGSEDDGWKAVLHCGGSVQYNRYMHFVHQRALNSFIAETSGKRVLDAGCGVGRLTTHFAKRGAHVIAIDGSQSMLKIAQRSLRSQNLKATFTQMDLTQLGLRDTSFDLVSCIIVLLHLSEDKDFHSAIGEMIRVTRPGGYILILDEIPKDRSSGQVGHKRVLNDYREAIEAAGGQIEEVRLVAVSPYRLVLSRILNSRWPRFLKNLATWSSYVTLGLMDFTLTGLTCIPLRFWMEDRLMIVRKPPGYLK
jgi:2-polyprenyl-3-methyl-5-hydroxy-6-metoxy-1,4-benzoquinol methylase